jgi:beta-1,2-mannobiose phosphorylase / 1,2-beta-oligomannan phosphorylase
VVSKDRLHWDVLGWATPADIDDRDVILFPEKIGGRYALLRRPIGFVETTTSHSEEHPSVQISFSTDLRTWTEPEVVIRPEFKWEDNRIGGSTPPVRTERGWLVLYHGVENTNLATRRVIYRIGAMMLDLADPRKVIARAPDFIMEPEAYYEKVGLLIPNVIVTTGAVVKDGLLYIYYGCCDTSIGLATVPLEELVDHVLATGCRRR